MAIKLTEEQTAVRDGILHWLKNWHKKSEHKRDVCVLAGWAGTGKTTLIIELLKSLNRSVLMNTAMVTYTGKASDVLGQKLADFGARPGYVGTIHSVFYTPKGINDDTDELEFDKKSSDSQGNVIEDGFLGDSYVAMPIVRNGVWSRVYIKFLIIDELSMIDEKIFKDLVDLKIPILFCGDHGQVAPVKGRTSARLNKADFTLETVHRQALDNPIIKAATFIRTGKGLGFGQLANCLIRFRPTPANMTPLITRFIDKYFKERNGTGVILCAKNRTRHNFNARVRKQLGLADFPYPQEGELVVCLKNDSDTGLKNGTLCYVTEGCEPEPDSWKVPPGDWDDFGLDDGEVDDQEVSQFTRGTMQVLPVHGGDPVDVLCHLQCFGKDLAKNDLLTFQDRMFFDFGYALTVHKSQGSEWDSVFLVNQKMWGQSQEEYTRWLYTGVTRAAKSLMIAG